MAEGRNKVAGGRDTFITRLSLATLKFLTMFTIAGWLERIVTFSWFFVDVWVTAWTLIALFCYVGSVFFTFPLAATILVVALGAMRINEILTFHIREIIGPRGAAYSLHSYSRTLVLLIANYAEIILWFACFYSLLRRYGLLVAAEPHAISILRESLSLMVANSVGALDLQQNLLPWIVVTAQSAMGLFMTTVVAARVISILPRPAVFDSGDGGGDGTS